MKTTGIFKLRRKDPLQLEMKEDNDSRTGRQACVAKGGQSGIGDVVMRFHASNLGPITAREHGFTVDHICKQAPDLLRGKR